MKKFCIPLLAAFAMTMTGCNLTALESALDSAHSPVDLNSVSDTAASGENTRCTVGIVSFDVDASWTAMEGYEGSFCTSDRKTVYQLQGESILGSYTPEEFFQNLHDGYKDKGYDISRVDDALTELTLPDGAQAVVGRIEMTANKTFFSIDVLIIPQKNTVLTFASQCAEGNTPAGDIRDVSSTAAVDAGTEDYISGNTFLADDGSQLCLNSDGTFIYYEHADTEDSAYTSGTYEVYYGQDAVDKAASMEEYGLTAEELEQVLAANMNGYTLNSDLLFSMTQEPEDTYRVCKDTFYAVILHNTCFKDSEGESEMDIDTLYIGQYIAELNYADMVNANSANYAGWTLQGVTE